MRKFAESDFVRVKHPASGIWVNAIYYKESQDSHVVTNAYGHAMYIDDDEIEPAGTIVSMRPDAAQNSTVVMNAIREAMKAAPGEMPVSELMGVLLITILNIWAALPNDRK